MVQENILSRTAAGTKGDGKTDFSQGREFFTKDTMIYTESGLREN